MKVNSAHLKKLSLRDLLQMVRGPGLNGHELVAHDF